MRRLTYQFLIPALIASVTTVVATSCTSYLLARPWCIQINPDQSQRILYGQSNCSEDDPMSTASRSVRSRVIESGQLD